MANDERQSETFIREVDEELRRDQLKALWDRFGWAFIGVCVLIVAITAGYRGWLWWEQKRAAEAGDRFMAAVEAIESGNREEGEAALQTIAETGGAGYAALARLRLAGESATSGDKEAALGEYDALTEDKALTQSLRDVARIRAALLALDLGDEAGAVDRAESLNESGNPWRHEAREVLGTAAYAAGDLQDARDYFTEIQQDAETPADIWQRAIAMVALIDGQLGPVPSSSEDATDAGASEPEMSETDESGSSGDADGATTDTPANDASSDTASEAAGE